MITTLILEQLNEDNGLLKQVEFTDEVPFHISETVDHNIRIQGSEKPHLVLAGLDIICRRYLEIPRTSYATHILIVYLVVSLDIVLKNYVVPESLTWASKTMSYTEPSQGVLTSSVLLNKIINNNNNNSKYNEKITIINKNKFPELLYHNGKNFIIFCDPIKTCKLVNVSCGQLRLLVII